MRTKISEADYCRAYNECACYISQKYGKKNVTTDPDGKISIDKVGDNSTLSDDFFYAVLSFIEYSKKGDSQSRIEFLSACDTAYKSIRKSIFKGARIRRSQF